MIEKVRRKKIQKTFLSVIGGWFLLASSLYGTESKKGIIPSYKTWGDVAEEEEERERRNPWKVEPAEDILPRSMRVSTLQFVDSQHCVRSGRGDIKVSSFFDPKEWTSQILVQEDLSTRRREQFSQDSLKRDVFKKEMALLSFFCCRSILNEALMVARIFKDLESKRELEGINRRSILTYNELSKTLKTKSLEDFLKEIKRTELMSSSLVRDFLPFFEVKVEKRYPRSIDELIDDLFYSGEEKA